MGSKSQLILPTKHAADDSQCIVRCTSEQHRTLERLLYRRYPHEEWGTFFRFGYRKTAWGLVIALGVAAGMAEPFGVPAVGVINSISYTLWAVWTLVLGIVLLRGERREPVAMPQTT